MLGDLNPDLLYVIVFGPGVGESIVLRIPPAHWVVVDSFLSDDVSPAAELLSKLDVEWSGVVLTHDHEDHAPGLAKVLGMKGNGPVGCSMPFILKAREQSNSADGRRLINLGLAEDALATNDQRWEDDTNAVWDLKPGNVRTVADAAFEPLWPDTALLPEYQDGQQNRFSTPMLVTWKGLRLLLGADLPTREWDAVGKLYRGLGDHALYKVAHHCSKGSVSHVYAPPDHPERRTWIATPFSKSHLPRFADGNGVDQLLQRVAELHLTSLPHPPTAASGSPREVRRSDLRDSAFQTLGAGVVLIKRPQYLRQHVMTHFVIAAGFAEDGTRADIKHGQGTLIVRQ
jgi:hypothetical protein